MEAQVYTINHPQEYLVNSKGTLPSGTFPLPPPKGKVFLQSEMLAMVSILLPPKSKVFSSLAPSRTRHTIQPLRGPYSLLVRYLANNVPTTPFSLSSNTPHTSQLDTSKRCHICKAKVFEKGVLVVPLSCKWI